MSRSSPGSALVLQLCLLVACASSDGAAGSTDAGGAKRTLDGAISGANGGTGSTGSASSGGRAASGAGSGQNGGSAGGTSGANGGGGDGGAVTSAGNGGALSEGGVAAGGKPAACPASDSGSTALGTDAFVPNTGKTEISSLTYTNVGASGAYAQVVTGWSKATGCVGDTSGTLCQTVYRQPKQVSGSLSPFDDEMTFVFAGPIELYQIAVYAPSSGAWQRTAYWDRCVTDGLVFAGNKSWYECGGFVESYVTADGTAKSDVPGQFSGSLAAGTEVNVMSSALCSGATSGSDCGWSSGLPLHGFKGDAAGSKIFAVKLRMPLGTKTPAYWILPSQVIRSSQYGCNCRGQGSDPVYKGGCGELDVAEILGGVTTSLEATTTLYSFQGITGGGAVAFDRPVNEPAVFLVIFDAASSQIAIRRLAATDFDFAGAVSSARVAALLADSGAQRPL